jgi:hypothetical protein
MTSLTRYSGLRLVDLPDCESLLENGHCGCLNVYECTGNSCPFYRARGTQDQANKRLCALDDFEQERIAQKYYHGKRTWRTASVTKE